MKSGSQALIDTPRRFPQKGYVPAGYFPFHIALLE
jgi:hypothetical protein